MNDSANPYAKHGGSRMQYLRVLAKDFGVPLSTVQALAGTLGQNEDFDGLVTSLEDFCDDADLN